MRPKHFLITDTETTGIGNKAIVFDIAYVIATRNKVILERNFLVREIITNPRYMLGALQDGYWRDMFGGKIFHHYIPGLHNGNLSIHGWRDIVETMRDDMRTYDVDVFCAYNLPFDTGAIGKTQHKICDGGKVLEYKPDMLCLWDFACSSVCNTALYHEVARELGEENGWVTEKGNIRTTAEKTYAFLSGNHDFIESHTALEDAQIETEILQRLLAKRKPIPYNNPDVWMPWRRAQKVKGSLL